MAVFENFSGFSISSANKMKALIPDELQKLQMGCLKVFLAPSNDYHQSSRPLTNVRASGLPCATHWHFHFESAMVSLVRCTCALVLVSIANSLIILLFHSRPAHPPALQPNS